MDPDLLLDPLNPPKHCPQCAKTGINSKLKKLKIKSGSTEMVIMCKNDQCPWPFSVHSRVEVKVSDGVLVGTPPTNSPSQTLENRQIKVETSPCYKIPPNITTEVTSPNYKKSELVQVFSPFSTVKAEPAPVTNSPLKSPQELSPPQEELLGSSVTSNDNHNVADEAFNEEECSVNGQIIPSNSAHYVQFNNQSVLPQKPISEKRLKTFTSLQNIVKTNTDPKPHQCKHCEASFSKSGGLVIHVRYKHTHEKPHKCPDCEYRAVEPSKLRRHMTCHSGERPYQCPHCTYASADTFKWKRHLRIHTGEKPYECDVCHSTFNQSNSLKAHRVIHTDDRLVYRCNFCPTTCGKKASLWMHVQRLHTSERPMHCKMCGKSFPDRYTLKVHKKTHRGEKCFKCGLCPYSSTSEQSLNSHMFTHSDQKPFQCDQCDQSFRQKQLLRKHQIQNHNPAHMPPATNECPECSMIFRQTADLTRHMALHVPKATAQNHIENINGAEATNDGIENEDNYDKGIVTVSYRSNKIRDAAVNSRSTTERMLMSHLIQRGTCPMCRKEMIVNQLLGHAAECQG